MSFYNVRWFTTVKDGKYVVNGPKDETYSFDTQWAADEMRRFCQALERQDFDLDYSTVKLTSTNGSTTSYISTYFKLNDHTFLEQNSCGNVTKFDLPFLVVLWFKTTSLYKTVAKLSTFIKKLPVRLWRGWNEN